MNPDPLDLSRDSDVDRMISAAEDRAIERERIERAAKAAHDFLRKSPKMSTD